MVSGQLTGIQKTSSNDNTLPSDSGLLGAEVLKTAIDFDSLVSQGKSATQAFGEMKSGKKNYHPEILQTLRDIQVAQVEMQPKVVKIGDLNDSMILAEDVRTQNGALLAAKDQQVSVSVRKLLMNYVEQKTIKDTTIKKTA